MVINECMIFWNVIAWENWHDCHELYLFWINSNPKILSTPSVNISCVFNSNNFNLFLFWVNSRQKLIWYSLWYYISRWNAAKNFFNFRNEWIITADMKFAGWWTQICLYLVHVERLYYNKFSLIILIKEQVDDMFLHKIEVIT